MTMVTWLGEDALHPDGNGPRFNEWRGTRFEVGKPVEIDNPHMVAKARGNPFYSVDGEAKRGPGRPPNPKPELKVEEPKAGDA